MRAREIWGGDYNLWGSNTRDWAYNQLTTPVAFLSTIPSDPFVDKTPQTTPNGSIRQAKGYIYQHLLWKNDSTGYDGRTYRLGYYWYLKYPGPARIVTTPYITHMAVNGRPNMIYDSTNGTLSVGNIYRTNKGAFTGSGL